MGKSYRQLSLDERVQLQVGIGNGLGMRAMARELARSVSTISRELQRNGCRNPVPIGRRGRPRVAAAYSAATADQRACRLTHTPRVERRLLPGTEMWELMVDHLRGGLSPEQIGHTLKRMHPDEPDHHFAHETIYAAIYAMPRGELRTEVIALLRFCHNKRRPRARGKDRRGKIPNAVSIHDRPAEIAERLVPGHWEGDLIKGKFNRSSVGTLVERTMLFTVLAKMDGNGAEAAVEGFSHVLKRIDAQHRLSMTYDNGSEMARHEEITARTGVKVYFADPHSPWQRGINENTNGLLRQYLPKGEDLSVHSQEDLDKIAWLMNTRPRKTLGWKCPAEIFLPNFDFLAYMRRVFPMKKTINVSSQP